MIKDHDQLNLQLQKVAIQHGVTLPTSPDEEGKTSMKNLSKFSGQDFDRQYMQSMLEDHQKDIAKLQKFGETTQTPAMKDLVAQTLPILENHIRVAENVSGQIGLTADKGLNEPSHPGASAGQTLPG